MNKWMIGLVVLLALAMQTGCKGGDFNGTGVKSGAADIIPPMVLGTYPANGATTVGINDNVWVKFSEAIDPFTVTGTTFTLTSGTSSIFGSVGMSGDVWAYFQPQSQLVYGATYTATVTTGIKDRAGNALAANYSFSFTVNAAPDTTPPLVITKTPAAGATGVSTKTAVSAGFSEALNPGTVTGTTFTLASGAAQVVSTVSYSGTTALLTPSAALTSGTTYTATLTTGIADLAGNGLAVNNAWSFTTAAAPSITTTTLPNGTETGAYSFTLASSGGVAPYLWSTPTASLPSGLSLSTAGVLSGTLAAGTKTGSPYTINVTLTDGDGLIATKALTLTVGSGPSFVENVLAQGTITGPYSQTITGTGGLAPYTWSATGLPAGVSLLAAGPSATTSLTSAAITASAATYPVAITVTDRNALVSTKNVALVVNAVPVVSTTPLADAAMGIVYAGTLAASNGTTPYSSWSATPLPAGITVNTSTGSLSGVASGPTGTTDVGITVTDARTVTSVTTTLPILVRPGISTASLPASTETGTYSLTLAGTGTGGLTWSQTGLPAGMLFNTGTGAISGAPNAGTAGTYPVDFVLTDGNSVPSAIKTLTLVVNPVATITTPTTLTQWTSTNGPQTVNLAATSGTPPYAWSSTDRAANAPWLSLTAQGVLSGTATVPGSYTFNITVMDKWNVVTTATFTATVP